VWEMPLYSRVDGKLVRQYLPRRERAVSVSASNREQMRKAQMITAYASQAEFLRGFDVATEHFLPQPPHDYSFPPHDGQLNYECWGWEISGGDLCAVFERIKNKNRIRRAKSA